MGYRYGCIVRLHMRLSSNMQSGLHRDSHNHPVPQNIVIPISGWTFGCGLGVADDSGTVLLEGQWGRALEIDPPPELHNSHPDPQTAKSQAFPTIPAQSPPPRGVEEGGG